jgi:hypothetical protein
MNAPPDLDLSTKIRADDMAKIKKILAENKKESYKNSI